MRREGDCVGGNDEVQSDRGLWQTTMPTFLEGLRKTAKIPPVRIAGVPAQI